MSFVSEIIIRLGYSVRERARRKRHHRQPLQENCIRLLRAEVVQSAGFLVFFPAAVKKKSLHSRWLSQLHSKHKQGEKRMCHTKKKCMFKENIITYPLFAPLFHLSYCCLCVCCLDGRQDGRRSDAQLEQLLSGHRPLPVRLWRPETFTRQRR